MSTKTTLTNKKAGVLLSIFGLLGLIASTTLLHDVIELAKNPEYIPICSINPILSCTSVMASAQAELFGIPNPVFGVIAFTALITFGVLLLTGTLFARAIWQLAVAAGFMGILFSHYLFIQSMFVLGTICPWCSLIWVITIAIFWVIVSYALENKLLGTSKRLTLISELWGKYRLPILISWYLLLIAIIFVRFNEFWMSLL